MDVTNAIVLDGSVTMVWGFEDEANDYAEAVLDRISSLQAFTVDAETAAHAWHETMHLARAHGLSAYDAAYLELAIRLGLPLASLDDKLKAAAVAVGVPLYAAS